jgi:hypothetical protein
MGKLVSDPLQYTQGEVEVTLDWLPDSAFCDACHIQHSRMVTDIWDSYNDPLHPNTQNNANHAFRKIQNFGR